MASLEYTHTTRARLHDVLDIHLGTANLAEMAPPILRAWCSSDEAITAGAIVEYRFWVGPIRLKSTVRFVSVDSDYGFTAIQYRGPLRRYEHIVVITADRDAMVRLSHRITYAHKPGLRGLASRVALGPRFLRWVLRSASRRMERILADAESAREGP